MALKHNPPHSNGTANPYVERGAIVRVRFDPIEGSEQGGERPALVISPALLNDHSTVIIVAAITSRKVERIYPFEAWHRGIEA